MKFARQEHTCNLRNNFHDRTITGQLCVVSIIKSNIKPRRVCFLLLATLKANPRFRFKLVRGNKEWSCFLVWRRHWVPCQRTHGSTLTVTWFRVTPNQPRKKYAVRMALLTMVDVIWSSLLVAGARWVSRAVKLPKPYSAQVKRCSSRWCVCHHWANTTNAPSMWTVLPNDVWPSLRLEWPDVQQQVYI